MSFSSFFVDIRKQNHLTHDEFAEKLNISNAQVRNIEKGRTSLPRYDTFLKLCEYIGEDPFQAAYNAFFKDEPKYDHLKKISKAYLAKKFTEQCIIEPDIVLDKTDGKQYFLDGSFYKSGLPYYHVVLGDIHLKNFHIATSVENRIDKLKEAIFSETLFFDDLNNPGYIKEIRFLLDNQKVEQRLLFNELNSISIRNLGTIFDVSFVLYDYLADNKNTTEKLHYVTNRRKSTII